MHCYLATCYKVTRERDASVIFLCAYLDVNVNLVTVAVLPTGGEVMLKGKECVFLQIPPTLAVWLVWPAADCWACCVLYLALLVATIQRHNPRELWLSF